MENLSELTTESINPRTYRIDECSTREILTLINEEDQKIAPAVASQIDRITEAADLIYNALKTGGRLFYVGAGTSGRLGVLDASECPPTYGTDPSMVQGFIAGGDRALRVSAEGCEDDPNVGALLMEEHGIGKNDVVVGITASGRTPFVLGAVQRARELGAGTVGVVNNENSKLNSLCDICIAPVVGAEVIVGSTRMKSGTAQKLVLNMLTTCVMIRLGKVYNNLMVDLKANNQKLYDRSIRIVCRSTGVSPDTAANYLKQADNHAKAAILMIHSELGCSEALSLLEICGGKLKVAIQTAAQNPKKGDYPNG